MNTQLAELKAKEYRWKGKTGEYAWKPTAEEQEILNKSKAVYSIQRYKHFSNGSFNDARKIGPDAQHGNFWSEVYTFGNKEARVVYSYATPIAIQFKGQPMYKVNQKFSLSTSKQQGRLYDNVKHLEPVKFVKLLDKVSKTFGTYLDKGWIRI